MELVRMENFFFQLFKYINMFKFFLLIMFLLISVSVLFMVLTNNPVYATLAFLLTIFFMSIVIMALGLDFMAITVLLVYFGAISIFFLFVVMTLKAPKEQLEDRPLYLLKCSLGVIFIFAYIFICAREYQLHMDDYAAALEVTHNNLYVTHELYEDNIQAVGSKLYTVYAGEFILLGITLFFAMIGAVNMVRHLQRIDPNEVKSLSQLIKELVKEFLDHNK